MAHPGHPVRVGAAGDVPEAGRSSSSDATSGASSRRPRSRAAGPASDRVAIANTRTAAPEDVLGADGDLKIATFNMLNYFNTFGEAWAASDGSTPGTTAGYDLTNPRRCNYYTDRGPVRRLQHRGRLTNDKCIQDADRPADRAEGPAPRPARRGQRGELPAPGGQGARGDQHHRRRRDVAGGGRELDQALRRGDRRPDGADKDRDDALKRLVAAAQRALGGRAPGVRRTAGPTRPRRGPRRCRPSPSRTRSARRSSTTRARSSPSAGRRCWSTPRRSATPASRWPRRSSRSAAAGPTRSA